MLDWQMHEARRLKAALCGDETQSLTGDWIKLDPHPGIFHSEQPQS
jgi:hypothetical protein